MCDLFLNYAIKIGSETTKVTGQMNARLFVLVSFRKRKASQTCRTEKTSEVVCVSGVYVKHGCTHVMHNLDFDKEVALAQGMC